MEEAVERLRSPYASEDFSALTGEPALVVDLEIECTVSDAGALAAARKVLAQLPCPTIAIASDMPSGPAARLADRFDLLLASASELDVILGAIGRTPLAALALVQLLRHNETLDIHEGLVAESLVYSMLQSGPEFAAWRAATEQRPQREGGTGPAVLVARDAEGLLRLTLNRPRKRNAFSAQMRDALAEALRIALADPSVREIRLDGAGPAFCSGGDLDEFGRFPDPATAHAIRSTRNPARLLAACADRVRVELHGACVGAGIELPAFTHHITAAPDAFFQLPEVGMGLVPGAGGTASIPRRIGRQRTAYLALSGQRVDAPTALAWGLVDEIRPRQTAAV